ncbi:low-density lipoprotein receptor-related protein 4 [Ixodes scapularis]
MAKGRCHVIGFKFNDPVFQSTYIALSAVGAALLILLCGALIVWRKKRRREHDVVGRGAPHLGRFPPSHGPGPADILEKKPWGWGAKVRYDGTDDKPVSIAAKEKLDNLEVAALVSKRLDELESGMLSISATASGDKGYYGLPLNGCPTPPSPPKVPCPRHSPHGQRCGSLPRTLPHEPSYHHHHHHHHHRHPPSVETDI